MNTNPESASLIAFARAASKAQEIEALLKETLILVEVATDTRNRSLTAISKEIEKLPLGPLRDRYLKSIGKSIADSDPTFLQMWKDINDQRVFLMHRFFQFFPISGLTGNKDAASRLEYIDRLLDIGRRMLTDARDLTLRQFNLTPAKLRDMLAFVTERRTKGPISE